MVWLELDQRINRYHDFGAVPENESQGWFEFGRACADRVRHETFLFIARDGANGNVNHALRKTWENGRDKLYAKPADTGPAVPVAA